MAYAAGEFRGRVLLYDDIDGAHHAEAAQAAAAIEEHFWADPKLATETLHDYSSQLADPDTVLSPVEITADEAGDKKYAVALSISNLLSHTANGGFMYFDDLTEDRMAVDREHQKLVTEAQNRDKRSTADPRVVRRQIALSGLNTFIKTWRHTWGPQQSDELDEKVA